MADALETKILNPQASAYHPVAVLPTPTQETPLSIEKAFLLTHQFSHMQSQEKLLQAAQHIMQVVPYKWPFQYYYTGAQFCHYNAFSMFPYNNLASYKYQFSGGGSMPDQKAAPALAWAPTGENGVKAAFHGGKEKMISARAGFRDFKGSVPPRLLERRYSELKKDKVWAVKNRSEAAVQSSDANDRYVSFLSGKTSVMIRNVPNRLGRDDLLHILDGHCREENVKAHHDPHRSSYDFLYLPMDFVKRANLGYAFVNFTSTVAAIKFCRAFDKFAWEVPGNKKICEITLAKYQGKELSRRFMNSRFSCHTDVYLPVVLSPPSDGFVQYRLSLLGERVNKKTSSSPIMA